MLHRRTLLGTALALPALAQTWPTRPIRLVVPFPAGGPTDVVARVLAEGLQARLGQPCVVENRTGAAGNVGAEAVVRSPADGYTLLMGTSGALTVNPHLYRDMTFDPARDLSPVSMVFSTDHVVIINPGVQARTLAEFLALARAQPGAINYGSAGAGSSTHMVGALFALQAQVNLTHVPYRGSAPALNDLVAGTVQVMFDQIPSAIGQIRANTVRTLAVTGARRNPLLPDVPTVAEAGVPGFEATSWGGIFAPANLPTEITQRLNGTIRAVLAEDATKQRMAAVGADPVVSTPAEMAAKMAAERTVWARVVAEARITAN
jgi:tripartite-type tricarboxylate transporter receptor subunit TctC